MFGLFKKSDKKEIVKMIRTLNVSEFSSRKSELSLAINSFFEHKKFTTITDNVVSILVAEFGVTKAAVIIAYICEHAPDFVVSKTISENTMTLLLEAGRSYLTSNELVALIGSGQKDVIKMRVLANRKKAEMLTELATTDVEKAIINLRAQHEELMFEQLLGDGESVERDLTLLNLRRDIAVLESPDNKKPEVIKSFAKEILDFKLMNKLITNKEYEREVSTLDNKPWYNFNIHIDEKNVNNFEFDIDYNPQFIEKLKDAGFVLTELELGNVKDSTDTEEDFDKAVEGEIIDKWLKTNLIKIVAGFLQSENGDHFKSVLADEPAATIVEELEIDPSAIGADSPIGLKDFVEQIKNRKSYR